MEVITAVAVMSKLKDNLDQNQRQRLIDAIDKCLTRLAATPEMYFTMDASDVPSLFLAWIRLPEIEIKLPIQESNQIVSVRAFDENSLTHYLLALYGRIIASDGVVPTTGLEAITKSVSKMQLEFWNKFETATHDLDLTKESSFFTRQHNLEDGCSFTSITLDTGSGEEGRKSRIGRTFEASEQQFLAMIIYASASDLLARIEASNDNAAKPRNQAADANQQPTTALTFDGRTLDEWQRVLLVEQSEDTRRKAASVLTEGRWNAEIIQAIKRALVEVVPAWALHDVSTPIEYSQSTFDVLMFLEKHSQPKEFDDLMAQLLNPQIPNVCIMAAEYYSAFYQVNGDKLSAVSRLARVVDLLEKPDVEPGSNLSNSLLLCSMALLKDVPQDSDVRRQRRTLSDGRSARRRSVLARAVCHRRLRSWI